MWLTLNQHRKKQTSESCFTSSTLLKNSAKRIIVYANGTNVIILYICCYASKLMTQFDELWIKTGPLSHLSVHEIANSLHSSLCKLLQFLHSFSGGRDTTSNPYFGSKKGWLNVLTKVNFYALESLGEYQQFEITDDFIPQARDLIITTQVKCNARMSLSDVMANKFFMNEAT